MYKDNGQLMLYTFSICLCYIWLISIPLYMLMYKVGPLYMFIYKVGCPDRSDTPSATIYSVVGWPFGLSIQLCCHPFGKGCPPGWNEGLIHPTVTSRLTVGYVSDRALIDVKCLGIIGI